MGWDPDTQQLQELSAEQAASWSKGPVFKTGEEVTIKGLIFIITDIAPGQIKMRPKRMSLAEQREALNKPVLDAAKMCPPGSKPLA